jgi:glycosyltransferase involved in cell wall biosynthesis
MRRVEMTGDAGPAASDRVNEDSTRPLDGVRVCIVRAHNFAMDARSRKQAATLADAGAQVTMVGIGTEVPGDLIADGRKVVLVRPASPPPLPRLGRPSVWWPVRVAVNLTLTRALQRRHANRLLLLGAYEDELADSIEQLMPDVVHAHNIHTLSAAIEVKRRSGARVLYDNRDLYWDADYVSEDTRTRMREVEQQLIGRVDGVITVCGPRADILESLYQVRRPAVIYNGPVDVMQSAGPVHEPVRLLFQGAFSHSRNLEALIEAMSSLRGAARLTLQGFHADEQRLHALSKSLDLESSVDFVPPVEPLEVVKSAAAHDVGIICHKGDSLNLRSTVPNKLMDYLGAGLALAVSDLPGHRSVLEGTGAAIFIDPSSAASMTESLQLLVSNTEQIRAMKLAALETAMAYRWSVQGEKLVEVYRSIL